MHFIQPSDRNQIEMLSLESAIGAENTVRLIDAFADQLDLKRLGFTVSDLNDQGRPAFESHLFIKLYFNVYMNGLRNDQTKMGLPAAGRATITPT